MLWKRTLISIGKHLLSDEQTLSTKPSLFVSVRPYHRSVPRILLIYLSFSHPLCASLSMNTCVPSTTSVAVKEWLMGACVTSYFLTNASRKMKAKHFHLGCVECVWCERRISNGMGCDEWRPRVNWLRVCFGESQIKVLTKKALWKRHPCLGETSKICVDQQESENHAEVRS